MIDDDGKLKQRWLNKSVNSLKEGVVFDLSFEEFCDLVKNANLVSSELGFSGGKKFVLARYGDTGGYVYGNCRFITQSENALEKNTTEKMKNVSRSNLDKARKVSKKLFESNPKILVDAGKKGALARNAMVSKQINANDKVLLLRSFDKKYVDYPQFGWKKRLAEEFGITKRKLDRFLERNASIVKKL